MSENIPKACFMEFRDRSLPENLQRPFILRPNDEDAIRKLISRVQTIFFFWTKTSNAAQIFFDLKEDIRGK